MGRLIVAGVGLEAGQMTMRAAQILKNGMRVILHTDHIGCAAWLRSENIGFESLDSLYETETDFDRHAQKAAEYVLKTAEKQDVVYVVYDIRDRSVAAILSTHSNVEVIPGPPVEGVLLGSAAGNTRMLEASEWDSYVLSAGENALIREIDSRQLASEVKLKLMECYSEDTKVLMLKPDGGLARLPLYDIDRLKSYDHRCCVLVPAEKDITAQSRYDFNDLVRIMKILQAPNGCSWDRAQTHASLRTCLLEETYEVIEAIDNDDPEHLYDELGDLMMNIVMQAVIAEKHGEFDIGDSLTAICKKMIRRHTHIFGGDRAENPDAVIDLWTRNKMKERGQTDYTQVLRDVAKTLPALMRSEKIMGKAASSGISCPETIDTLNQLKAVEDLPSTSESIGKALMLMTMIAKNAGIDAELALNAAVDNFINRFEKYETDKNA